MTMACTRWAALRMPVSMAWCISCTNQCIHPKYASHVRMRFKSHFLPTWIADYLLMSMLILQQFRCNLKVIYQFFGEFGQIPLLSVSVVTPSRYCYFGMVFRGFKIVSLFSKWHIFKCWRWGRQSKGWYGKCQGVISGAELVLVIGSSPI